MPALGAEAERAPEWGQQWSMPFGVQGGLRPSHFGLAKGRCLVVSLRSRVERGLRSGRLGRLVLGRLRGKVGWLWGCGWSRGWRGVDELTCTALLAPLPPVRAACHGRRPLWGAVDWTRVGISCRGSCGPAVAELCAPGAVGVGRGREPLRLLEDVIQERVDLACQSPRCPPGDPRPPSGRRLLF